LLNNADVDVDVDFNAVVFAAAVASESLPNHFIFDDDDVVVAAAVLSESF
jgi:hypothetical protein